MKLIVGLGNPTDEYKNTKHNVGFMIIDSFADLNKLSFKSKFNSLYAELIVNKEKVILLKPQTYMNLSGDSVIKFKNYYDIDNDDILVIYDDISFELGEFKIKPKGSAGGHNGIKDILNKLKTNDIKRIKIGISKNNKVLKDYVLSEFSKKEKEKLDKLLLITNNVLNDYLTIDFNSLMNKYNGKNYEK